MSYKSIYKPKNEEKYFGDLDKIICRSLWERQFAKWCDKNDHVLKWAIEPFFIRYFDYGMKKRRKYYPDFFILFDDGAKLLVEIKPKAQTLPPKNKNKKNYLNEQLTYMTNQSKWKKAKKICKEKGWTFMVLTEYGLEQLGIKIIPRKKWRKKKRKK